MSLEMSSVLTIPRPKGRAGAVIAGNLSFKNVGFAVGGHAILYDITLAVKAGEIVSVLGPSGCGKTTLMRLAAGVSKPTSGQIFLDDQEVAGPGRFVVPERRKVGLVFQDHVLFPHMTVLENVAYGLHGLRNKDAASAAFQALTRVGMAFARDELPHRLSGGEQQRVALARAIVPRPQVLLMDEPFSGLDQRLRESVRAETLGIIRETSATAILVTHDPVEALEVSDRIFLMRAGRIVQTGTPDQLYRAPVDAEAARFFSETNEAVGYIRNGRVQGWFGIASAKGFAEGAKVQVLIRPPAIRLQARGHGFAGLVKQARYLGDQMRLTLLVEGLESPVNALISSSPGVKEGEIHHFAVNPEEILVFAAV